MESIHRRFNAEWATTLAVAIAYATLTWVGFLTSTLDGPIAPIFPSAGIALAAVVKPVDPRERYGLRRIHGNSVGWRGKRVPVRVAAFVGKEGDYHGQHTR